MCASLFDQNDRAAHESEHGRHPNEDGPGNDVGHLALDRKRGKLWDRAAILCPSDPWALVMWLFVRQHLGPASGVYLLAGDESVVTQSGKATFGLERFFASLNDKGIAGLACFA